MPSHQNRQWSDEYMMYEYKVKQCLRTDHHNWKHCPWRHPGETAAQRRHPSVHKPTFCVNLKMAGECSAGDDCPFSHNTFEMSLHPLRYKTTLCNLGEKCNREICFFAHSHKDLRTPEPEAGDAAAAAAGVGGVALSGGSFSGATAAPGAAALGLVTNTGEVVQISNGSFTSGVGGELLSPAGGGGGLVLLQQVEQSAGSGLEQQQQQQQLLLLQLNSQQQQLMGLDNSAAAAGNVQGVESSGPSCGILSRVLPGSRGSLRGLEQQQPAVSRQDLCNFESFTSQGSFSGRQAASLQQQLLLQLQQQQQQQQQTAAMLRQDLGGFDSFTSQGSFSAAAAAAAGGSFTAAAGGGFTAGNNNTAVAMLQQQQQQQQQAAAAAAALRQELAHFGDSFTSQSSFSAGTGGSFTAGAGNSFAAGNARAAFGGGSNSFTAGVGIGGHFTVSGSGGSFSAGGRGLALQQHQQQQQAAALLQQELANYNDSFTSQGSRSLASLQQQAMLLRQELTGYDSVTSQSSFSTGGGSFTRSVAPGAALLQQQQQQLTPPMLDTAFDSFTSQCSTSSQLSGLGYRSMPLSPLMDRSQGSAVSQAQGFAAMAGQAGQGSQGSLPRVLAAPSPPGSVNAAAAGMLFGGNGQNAGNGNAMLPPSGPGGRRSLDAGPMLAPACAAPGGPTSSSLQQQQLAAKQQQEAAAAAVQQQVMQLQLRSAEWQQ
uniref:C3H1-type domain-containing protein n=1 Tax=Tetradesmus obliquus TaxID=3088 RepID=A0A383VHG2_TETOB|eukprot:jgi/Sobl393_1/18822/SZX64249.1